MYENFKKPKLEIEDMKELIGRLYGLKLETMYRMDSYDDINYHVFVDKEYVSNTFIDNVDGCGYTLKILNSLTSQNTDRIQVQHALIKCSINSGIRTSAVVLNTSGEEWSLEKLPSEDGDEDEFLVRLFNFIPGIPVKSVLISPSLCCQIGDLAGRIDQCLKSIVKNPGFDNSRWSLESAPELIKDMQLHNILPDYQQLLQTILQEYKKKVLSKYDQWQKGFIHHDINEGNILVKPVNNNNNNNTRNAPSKNEEYELTAVIDFGDISFSPYIFEISIAMTYIIFQSTDLDIIKLPGRAVSGYLQHIRLTNEELLVLKVCVCARVAQSIILGIMSQQDKATDTTLKLSALKKLWPIPDEKILALWTQS